MVKLALRLTEQRFPALCISFAYRVVNNLISWQGDFSSSQVKNKCMWYLFLMTFVLVKESLEYTSGCFSFLDTKI